MWNPGSGRGRPATPGAIDHELVHDRLLADRGLHPLSARCQDALLANAPFRSDTRAAAGHSCHMCLKGAALTTPHAAGKNGRRRTLEARRRDRIYGSRWITSVDVLPLGLPANV